MAAKKGKKPAKTLGKKDLKRTKGGILIGLNQPLAIQGEVKIDPGAIVSPRDNWKVKW